MDNSKRYVWGAVGLVVLLLVVWLVAKNMGNNEGDENNTDTTQTQPTPTPTPTPNPAGTNSNPSYDAALIKYGTNRIQFQQTCQTVPNNVVYKNGTTIMLDNRASIAHNIKIDGTTYTIGAYDYKILTMSNAKLPHTILVDCDKSQNVATILIEK